VRVMLADDAVLIREAIASLLEREGFEVVRQASTADELLRWLPVDLPDIVVLDIRMPPTHTDEGLRAAHAIRESHPDIAIHVLSQYEQIGYAMELLERGEKRAGYLLKERVSDADEFVRALRDVAAGGTVVDPKLVRLLLAQKRMADPLAELTQREREVLELMAQGLTDLGIARRLFIEPNTVDTHNRSIFRKLQLPADSAENRRVHAVLTWLRAAPE
jgi:DNA-binding NarL/FixJ family response regulator